MSKIMKFLSKNLNIFVTSLLILNDIKFTFAFCSTESANDPEYPYKLYNDITLYDTVGGNITMSDRPNELNECSIIHMVMVARHGSRHPGTDKEDIYKSFSALAKRLNSTENAEMCDNDLQKIQDWENWHQPALDLDLATTGYEEMYGLADRFLQAFPELFTDGNLDAGSYRFVSSSPKRVTESAEAFIEELFRNSGKPSPTLEINDQLIRPYAYCQKRLDRVNNSTLYEDVDKFLEGSYVTEVANRVASRLGLPRDEITNQIVNNIRLYGCAHEEWANGNDSAWCLPFRKEDLEVFEYYEDMWDYTRKSFSDEINYRPSCILKQFVLSSLKNASTDENNPLLGHFTFGHAPTITTLLTEMEIIPDGGPLKSDEYLENLDRSFRGSFYEPGAANILFVLYGCGESNEKKIQIFHNEKLVRMPLDDPAPDGLWNLEEALQYFNFYDPDDCNYDEMCSADDVVTDITTTTSKSQKIASDIFLMGIQVILGFGYPHFLRLF